MKSRFQDRYSRIDAAALLAFVAIWAYYVVMVRYGFCLADESTYLAIANRFVHGGRPLVDEWHVAQFSYFYLCPIIKLYVAVKGSMSGIILFMRYLFLAFNAVFYWIVYVLLRRYEWRALLVTLLFSTCVPFAIYACNYYNIPQRLLMLVFLILFTEKQKPVSLLLAGVLFACSVLEQPGLAFLYAGYTVLVWVRFFRQKKGKRFLDDYAFCINTRTWGYTGVSILACAAAFLAWLLQKSGLRNILASVPYILGTDPEYDYSAGGSAWSVVFRKLADVADTYSLACLIPASLVLLLAFAYARGAFQKRRDAAQKILFCLACAAWIACCVSPLRIPVRVLPDLYKGMFHVPFIWFALACYLLTERRNKRFLFFWTGALLSSLCIDVFSEVTLSIGHPIAYVAAVVFVADLVRELRGSRSGKSKSESVLSRNPKKARAINACARTFSRVLCVWFAVWFTFVLFYLENGARMAHEITGAPLFALTYRCEKGPYRSIFCDETFGKNYEDRLSDVDTLKRTNPKNLYIYGLAPELYLYADLPYATSAPYAWGDVRYLERNVLYWHLHPEHLPECIYITVDPFYNKLSDDPETVEQIRNTFDPLFDYTLEKGKSGYILYVSGWHPGTEPSAR